MEAHSNDEKFFYGRGYSFVCKWGGAEDYMKAKAAGCIPSLVEDVKIAQNTSSAFVDRLIVERIVLHLVPDVLACSTNQKRSFICPRREQGSIVEV